MGKIIERVRTRERRRVSRILMDAERERLQRMLAEHPVSRLMLLVDWLRGRRAGRA